MGEKAREELLEALKGLFNNPDYSDLTIASSQKRYPVHKAIVCPRSKFFDAQCRDKSSEACTMGTLNLPDDDPQAVEMLVQYLYHLDYPYIELASPLVNDNKTVELAEEEPQSPEVNGTIAVIDEAKPERLESQDEPDLHHESALMRPKPKSKKKRKKSVVIPQSAPEGPPSETIVRPEVEPVPEAIQESEFIAEIPPSEQTLAPLTGNLVTHAKVYSLSQKYGIEGLKYLALDKFETEAKVEWDSPDFLEAIKEVYNTPLEVTYDKGMQEAVTTIMFQHLDALLGKEETRSAIKGLPLSFDILIRWHENKAVAVA